MSLLRRLKVSRFTAIDYAMLVARLYLWYWSFYNFGALFGLILIAVVTLGSEHLIARAMDLEPLNSSDTALWYDSADNRCNVMCCFLVERHDGKALYDAYRNKLPTSFRRFRSRMVKVLDKWFFQELPPDELKRQLDRKVVMKSGIHTMDQLSDFFAE